MKSLLLCMFMLVICFSEIHAQSANDSSDVRIVLMADLNESYGSTQYGEFVDSAMVWIEKWQPDLILFAGDMIAGQSLALSEEEIRAMWSGFDETIGQPLREMDIPFAFTLGNHDGSGSGNFDHERELAKEYWSPHKPELNYVNNEHFPFYYSFKFKDLFVISWDASNHLITEEEIEWIEQQLSKQVAKEASKRIILGHLPLYAVAEGRNREGEILRDADELFEMMKRNNVDYYFSGHHHAWYPAEKEGLKMIHSGAQGSGPRPLIGSDLPPRRTITLLEREIGSSTFTITTFDLENNMEVISPEELPPVIKGINGRIERYDYED
jgi:hypothetical protein